MSKVFVHAVIAISLLLLGCRAEVDYSPPTSNRPSSGSSIAKTGKTGESTKNKSTKADEGTSRKTSASGAGSTQEEHQVILAYDEFDGEHRSGWMEEGLGEWSTAGEEQEEALVVSGDVELFRKLATPIKTGVVWYAVTMRMGTQVTGYASVAPSPNGVRPYSQLGFSAQTKPYTSRGLWLEPHEDTRIENTEKQTFLTRYNFDLRAAHGYAARSDGRTLVDDSGIVFARPRMRKEKSFDGRVLAYLGIRKKGPEKLIIDRVVIARTAEAALNPLGLEKPAEVVAEPDSAAASTTESNDQENKDSPATGGP